VERAVAVRYAGVTYPIEAWRLVYDYITARRAPDATFNRRMRALGVTLDNAYALYRAQLYTPWLIEFIRVPPEEEWISTEECSGLDIYYNTETKKYVIRDPDTLEKLREDKKIAMELTASIKTSGGHDKPVVVEITATTYLKEKDSAETIATEKQVNTALKDWLTEQGWERLIHAYEKVGVAYNGETHVKTVGRYPWEIPDHPKVHALVEKKKPRSRTYEGEFHAE